VEWRAEPGEPIERCICGEGGSAEKAVGNQPICRAEAEDVDDRQHDGYQGEPNEKEEVGAIVGHGDLPGCSSVAGAVACARLIVAARCAKQRYETEPLEHRPCFADRKTQLAEPRLVECHKFLQGVGEDTVEEVVEGLDVVVGGIFDC